MAGTRSTTLATRGSDASASRLRCGHFDEGEGVYLMLGELGVLAADANVTAAAGDATGFITDNGPTIIGVTVAFAIFGLTVRWVSRAFRGR